jgi:hypothetical protein
MSLTAIFNDPYKNETFFRSLKELRFLTTELSVDNNCDCNGTSLSGLERRLHDVGKLVRTLREKDMAEEQSELLEVSLYDITESLAALAGDLLDDDNDFSASIIEQYLGLANYSMEILQTKFPLGTSHTLLDLNSLQALILCGMSRLHSFQKQYDMARLEIIEAAALFRLVLLPLPISDERLLSRHAKTYGRVFNILASENSKPTILSIDSGSTSMSSKMAAMTLLVDGKPDKMDTPIVSNLGDDFYQV